MNFKEPIDKIESSIVKPSLGLPEEIFLFVSRVTPLINVDLLIKNEKNHTLLTWRYDGYYSPGWHVPGGIIRFKETISDRIKQVALAELGAQIEYESIPISIKEVIHKDRKNRGHFISLLYKCELITQLDKTLKCKNEFLPNKGEWMWHASCPDNIISVHNMYREFI